MQALVEISGKQFVAEKDMVLKVPKQTAIEGDKIIYDKVLCITKKNEKKFGKPYVENTSVEAEVVSHNRDKKIVVFKFKRRKGYQRKHGHKQNYTTIKINKISQKKTK